MVQPEPALVRN